MNTNLQRYVIPAAGQFIPAINKNPFVLVSHCANAIATDCVRPTADLKFFLRKEMTKILAILILSSGFNVAVETKDGVIERSFQNSLEGVSDFLTFAGPFVKSENLKFCAVSTVDESGAVMQWLIESGLQVGFLTYPVYK